MIFASGFTWFEWVLGPQLEAATTALGAEPHTGVLLAHALVVCVFLITLAILGRMALERRKALPGLQKYFPEGRMSVLTFWEVYAQGALNIMGDMLDKKDIRTFFPFVASLFIYLFFNNLYGLVPGFAPPTDNINTSVGIALLVFVLFNVVGLARDARGYLAHMWGPMFLTGFLLFPVEFISLVFRPVTLSLRITGNIFGDHTVFGVISDLAPPVVPVAILGLALFVSFIQAFIFTLLTTMYLAMAVPHHDDHEAH